MAWLFLYCTHSGRGLEAAYSTRLRLVLCGASLPRPPPPVLYYAYSINNHAITITYNIVHTCIHVQHVHVHAD